MTTSTVDDLYLSVDELYLSVDDLTLALVMHAARRWLTEERMHHMHAPLAPDACTQEVKACRHAGGGTRESSSCMEQLRPPTTSASACMYID